MRANSRRFWVLTLVTKQDLWWPDRALVESHYRSGEYRTLMHGVTEAVGKSNFRHELIFSSLVISNFTTGLGELLASTVAGYDQNLQAESLRRLWETIDALKNWEQQV